MYIFEQGRRTLKNTLAGALLLALIGTGCKTSEKAITGPSQGTGVTVTGVPFVYDPATVNQEEEAPRWVAKKGPYNPEETRYFHLIHTALDVRPDWGKQYLYGKATLTLSPYFYPQTEVVLDAKGFQINRVGLLAAKDTLPLTFNYNEEKLSVNLPKTYTRRDTFQLFIDYVARPNELATKGSQAITSDKGLYFINPLGEEPQKPVQLWTQGETQANSCWFPTFDAPNVKTRQELAITVDTAFTTLSNGKLVTQRFHPDGTRTDYWKQEKPHTPYLFMLAVGKFVIVEDEPWNDVPITYYMEPEFAPYAKAIFGRTREMIDFFSKKLDFPYPWEKYAQVIVRDFVSGAMENTSASVFMEQLNVDDRYLLDRNWDQIIGHELFHQWFGNIVTCESWANLPLNEAFANYSEYLWAEHYEGVDAASMIWEEELDTYLLEADSKQEPLIRYYYSDREDMFDSHSYSKGGLVLHLLRNHVGDDAFFESLSLFLKKHAYQAAEIHHLRLAFEEVTGQDMHWFFDQWFMAPGHPKIYVSQSYQNDTLNVRVRQQQDTRYTGIFRIPVEIDVWVGGEKQTHHVVLEEAEASFIFNTGGQEPNLVHFDPRSTIPCDIDYVKPTEAFIFQFYNAEGLLAKKQALLELANGLQEANIRNVFTDALSHPHWKIREIALEAFAEYEGTGKAALADRFKQMALKDPKSLVRAMALQVLASFPIGYLDVFEKAMKDSSYTVASAAIYAYANQQGLDLVDKLKEFEPLDDLTMVVTLADYYSFAGVPGKLPWFEQKMAKKGGQELPYIITWLGNYLIAMPPDVQQEGLSVLAKYTHVNQSYYVKLATFRTLDILSDLDEAKRMMQDMIAAETDAKALDFYRTLAD
jgi:aminopeptidase N